MRFFLFLFICGFVQPSYADKPKISGISWGGYRYPNSLSVIDDGNTAFDATGILRVDFGWQLGRADLIPYVSLFTQNDTLGYVYNSKMKAGIGISARYKIKPYSQLSFGVRYEYDYRPLTDTSFQGVILTGDFSYYRSWVRGKNGGHAILSGWANLRFPGSVLPSSKGNLIVQGAFDLAYERPIGKTKWRIAGFGGLGLAVDSKRNDFNNKQQLDFGFRLKKKVKKMDYIFSAKFRFENRSITRVQNSGPIIGVSWLRLF